MPRELPEWRGKTPDSAVPDRVRLRIFARCDGRCGCCNRKIMVGEKWDLEHTLAIINGGEHRESNMRPWLAEHHKGKTRRDVAIKSKTYRMAKKHRGVRGALRGNSSFPCSRASGWKKKLDGTVVRR